MKAAYVLAILCLALTACDWTNPIAHQGDSQYLKDFGPARQQQRAPTDPGAALPDDMSYWAGDGKKGAPLIKISRKQQKAYFYKGSELVGVSRISTGTEGNATRAGRFKVTEKDRDHRSSLYGVFKEKGSDRVVNDDADTSKDKVPPGCYYVGAPMWNFLRFDGGIGMHTGYLPGYNASHGCVRMPDHMAKKFFDNAKVGTPVIVE